MDAGKRFKQVREVMGLTQQEFGEKLGYRQSKIKDIETGKQKVSPEICELMEKNFSVHGWWLLTGRGRATIVQLALEDDGTYAVPELHKKNLIHESLRQAEIIDLRYYEDVYASAGYGATNDKLESKPITVSQFFLDSLGITNPKSLDVIRIYGDSMEPDFKNGEYVVVQRVDSLEEVDNGNTVIANIDGEIYIKKIEKIPFQKSIILNSTNPGYDPIKIEAEHLKELNIVGIVKGIIKPR